MDGRTNRLMESQKDFMVRETDGQTDRWLQVHIDGPTHRWVQVNMVGQTDKQTDRECMER